MRLVEIDQPFSIPNREMMTKKRTPPQRGAHDPRFVSPYDWPAICAEILEGVRAGRSVRAMVAERPDWPVYSRVLEMLNRDHYEEYQAAKRLGAEALGDDVNDMLRMLRDGDGDYRTARVFLEGAMRRMGQMNAEYNDKKVRHEHTHRVDDTLRERLEAAEARVKALEHTTIDGEATEVEDD